MLNKIFQKSPKGQFIEVRILERATKKVKFRRFFSTPNGAQEFGVQNSKEGFDAYFGVAPRVSNEPAKEKDKQVIQSVTAIWGDLDSSDWNIFPLTPSLVVSSGRGCHVYWILTEPTENTKDAERTMRMLSRSYENFDRGCWAVTHFLRIVGTVNHKYVPALPVEVIHDNDQRYDFADVDAMARLSQLTVKKIREGAAEEEDRSALDWHIICNLVSAGMSDDAIELIYRTHAIGSKYLERGAQYLRSTIDNARREVDSASEAKTKGVNVKGLSKSKKKADDDFVEEDDTSSAKKSSAKEEKNRQMDDLELIEFDGGYWDISGKRPTKVTDFTFTVEGMITSNDTSVGNTAIGEAFVCTMYAGGRRWDKVVFPTECFTSDKALRTHLKRATWSFSGNSKHAVAVQRLMRQMWEENGRNTQLTTNTIGLQLIQNRWLFAQTNGTIFDAFTGDLCENVLFTNTRTIGTLPPVNFDFTGSNKLSSASIQKVFDCLVGLRHPQVTVPLLGWLAASYFKHSVLTVDPTLRFPLFMLTGTQGSGKTTILRQFKRFIGVSDSAEGVSQISASTTRFVLNAALSGSNTVPIHLTEFREQTMRADAQLPVTLRQAYDGSSDPRGRADQTTQNYRFIAPVLIDGEESFHDPALMERTFSLPLQKNEITDNENFKRNNRTIISAPVEAVASKFLLFTQRVDVLQVLTEANDYLAEATRAYRHLLPDRVYNNCHIITVGLVVIANFLKENNVKCPFDFQRLSSYLELGLAQVVDINTGNSKLNVDSFVQAVLHRVAVMQGNLLDTSFQYRVLTDVEGRIQVAFNLATAYSWWLREIVLRHQQRSMVTDERALQRQLVNERHVKHGGYIVDVQRMKASTDVTARMYVVDVLKALEHDLDVPESYVHVSDLPTVSIEAGKLKLHVKK